MTGFIAALFGLGLWFSPVSGDGLVQIRSNATAAATVARVEPALAARGLRLFATVDHAANARAVNLELRPNTVFIFGNPAVGSRVMQCAATAGIDLPLKLLVWEEKDGSVWVGYNDPDWLARRHEVGECGGVLTGMKRAMATLAAEIAGHPIE
jgi:uncharacterized protein (DUF302 family)